MIEEDLPPRSDEAVVSSRRSKLSKKPLVSGGPQEVDVSEINVANSALQAKTIGSNKVVWDSACCCFKICPSTEEAPDSKVPSQLTNSSAEKSIESPSLVSSAKDQTTIKSKCTTKSVVKSQKTEVQKPAPSIKPKKPKKPAKTRESVHYFYHLVPPSNARQWNAAMSVIKPKPPVPLFQGVLNCLKRTFCTEKPSPAPEYVMMRPRTLCSVIQGLNNISEQLQYFNSVETGPPAELIERCKLADSQKNNSPSLIDQQNGKPQNGKPQNGKSQNGKSLERRITAKSHLSGTDRSKIPVRTFPGSEDYYIEVLKKSLNNNSNKT